MKVYEYAIGRAFAQRLEQERAGKLSEKERENLEVLREAVEQHVTRETRQ